MHGPIDGFIDHVMSTIVSKSSKWQNKLKTVFVTSWKNKELLTLALKARFSLTIINCWQLSMRSKNRIHDYFCKLWNPFEMFRPRSIHAVALQRCSRLFWNLRTTKTNQLGNIFHFVWALTRNETRIVSTKVWNEGEKQKFNFRKRV